MKLKPSEVTELLVKYNLSLGQLPKIKKDDPLLTEETQPGEVLRIERKEGEKLNVYYRVVA